MHTSYLCTKLPLSMTCGDRSHSPALAVGRTLGTYCSELQGSRSLLLFIAHSFFFANEWLLANNQGHIYSGHNSHLNALC